MNCLLSVDRVVASLTILHGNIAIVCYMGAMVDRIRSSAVANAVLIASNLRLSERVRDKAKERVVELIERYGDSIDAGRFNEEFVERVNAAMSVLGHLKVGDLGVDVVGEDLLGLSIAWVALDEVVDWGYRGWL